MRTIPKNISDLIYLISKIGFSPLRGILLWFFLARGSRPPFLGSGTKIISGGMIKCGKLVWIGQNFYIDAHSRDGVLLGNGVTLREGGSIQCRSGLNPPGVGLEIGENTFIGPNCKIGVGGKISIGKNCQVGSHCSLNAESHLPGEGGAYTTGKTLRKGISIGNNVWIGDGVIILDGVNVGSNTVIGAGSVVIKDIDEGTMVAGVPAKYIRDL